MKNYIIFYILLIVFIVGGIRYTSYSLEQEKKAELEGTNHYERALELINSGQEQLKPVETTGKSLVIYNWMEYGVKPEDFIQLNKLNNELGASSVVIAAATNDQEHVENYFVRKKVKPEFKVLHSQRLLITYTQSLMDNFYESDSIKNMKSTTPIVMVVDPAGKIKYYNIGKKAQLMNEIKAAVRD